MKKQLMITISASQGCDKNGLFKHIARYLARTLHSGSIFGFDGERRRMTAEERKDMAKSDIIILTKQKYKKRRIKKGK